jgi:hypothetical protein
VQQAQHHSPHQHGSDGSRPHALGRLHQRLLLHARLDERQLTDWLLRGTYPIVFGANDARIEEMRKEGRMDEIRVLGETFARALAKPAVGEVSPGTPVSKAGETPGVKTGVVSA